MMPFKNKLSKNKLFHPENMPPQAYSEAYVKLSHNRLIFLSEDITKKTASDLSALLLHYDEMSSEEEIILYINSNGGDAFALLNIYDVMQMIKAPIITVLMGKCYSAAAIILAAGAKGNRHAFRSSKIMIHGLQFAFPMINHDLTASKNYYDFLKDNNDKLMKILAKHTGQPLARIKQDCAQDLWMNTEQAYQYGMIDIII